MDETIVKAFWMFYLLHLTLLIYFVVCYFVVVVVVAVVAAADVGFTKEKFGKRVLPSNKITEKLVFIVNWQLLIKVSCVGGASPWNYYFMQTSKLPSGSVWKMFSLKTIFIMVVRDFALICLLLGSTISRNNSIYYE